MIFETRNQEFNKSTEIHLIYDVTKFTQHKTFSLKQTKLLFYQCSVLFDKIINQLTCEQVDSIIQNIKLSIFYSFKTPDFSLAGADSTSATSPWEPSASALCSVYVAPL